MLHHQSWKHILKQTDAKIFTRTLPAPWVLPGSKENNTKYTARWCGCISIATLYPKHLTAMQQRPSTVFWLYSTTVNSFSSTAVSCRPFNHLTETEVNFNVWATTVNKHHEISITVGKEVPQSLCKAHSKPEKTPQLLRQKKVCAPLTEPIDPSEKFKQQFVLDCFQHFCSITSDNESPPPFFYNYASILSSDAVVN